MVHNSGQRWAGQLSLLIKLNHANYHTNHITWKVLLIRHADNYVFLDDLLPVIMISKNSRPLKLYNGSQLFECVCSCYVCMIVFNTVKWIISESKRLLQMLMIYKIHFRIYIATNIWPAYRTFSFATMSRYYNFKWINIQAYFQSSLLHIIWIIWSPLLFESYKLYDNDNVESVWTSQNRILTTRKPIFRWRNPIYRPTKSQMHSKMI